MSNGTIAVDLDGTLAVYDGVWRGVDNIGAPIPRMVNRVKRWLAEGRRVVIFTARMSGHGQLDIKTGYPVDVEGPIRRWCAEHLGQELPVTCVKDFSVCEIWDDRAVQVIPNTGQTIQEKLDENFPWDSDFGHALLRNLEGGNDLAVDFAEYNTNRQLSLDNNLPGETRAHHKQLAKAAARRIVLKIC